MTYLLDKPIRPFLQWVGGKYNILKNIVSEFPPNKIRLVEPFVGAGALSLNTNFNNNIINDINSDLMSTWYFVRDFPHKLIHELELLFIEENNTKEKYLEFRHRFNNTKDPNEKVYLFFYLNKHCFNAISRFNNKGEFNTPFGYMKNPNFSKENIILVHNKIKKWTILNKNFRSIFTCLNKQDICFCDPPYVEFSSTSGKLKYHRGGFNYQDQLDLA